MIPANYLDVGTYAQTNSADHPIARGDDLATDEHHLQQVTAANARFSWATRSGPKNDKPFLTVGVGVAHSTSQ